MWETIVAIVMAATSIGMPSDGPYKPAERVDPPVVVTTTTEPEIILFTSEIWNSRCIGAQFLLTYFSPGWDVDRMMRIMHRESRCLPWAMNSNSSASGLLQILATTHCPWIRTEFGDCSRQWLADPINNIQAAASLWQKQGYGAWAV